MRYGLGCGAALVMCGAALRAAGAVPTATPLGSVAGAVEAPARLAVWAPAVGGGERLYVTDPPAGRLWVFDATGGVVAVKGGLARPLGVAVDAQGRVYVGEEGSGRVTVMDGGLNALYALGAGNGEFLLPNHISVEAVATNARVYVSDSRAKVVRGYDGATRAMTLGAPGGPAGTDFLFPAGVAVGTNGEVFVVDQYRDRVQVYGRDGGYRRGFALAVPGDTGLITGRAQGIVGDAQGRLFVADAFQGQVKVFDEQGNYLAIFGGLGAWIGELHAPVDVALGAADGRLFVASMNNRRAEVYGLDAFVNLTVLPASQTVRPGTNVSFQAAGVAAGPYTFQWMSGTNVLQNGPSLSGAATTVLSLLGVTPDASGTYTVVVSGPAGPAFSASGVLLVATAPAAPQIGSLAMPAGATMQLQIVLDAGYVFSMEASTDMVSWVTLATVTGQVGAVQVLDPAASTFRKRFYRLRWEP